jgi:hypothetical protein
LVALSEFVVDLICTRLLEIVSWKRSHKFVSLMPPILQAQICVKYALHIQNFNYIIIIVLINRGRGM